MAKVQGIKKQIRLIQQIQHVTRAMKTISAVRLRMEKAAIDQAETLLFHLKKNLSIARLFVPSPIIEEGKILLVGIFSDKGLVGGFNRNVVQAMDNFASTKGVERVSFISLGTQGTAELCRLGFSPLFTCSLSGYHVPHYHDVRELVYHILKVKERGGFTHLYLVFNRYLSVTRHFPHIVPVLPLQSPTQYLGAQEREKWRRQYLLCGDAQSFMKSLELQYVLGEFYRALVESFVSEQAVRFTIMDSATSHAQEMIESLNIVYHRKRQECITEELNEVIGAYEVLRELQGVEDLR